MTEKQPTGSVMAVRPNTSNTSADIEEMAADIDKLPPASISSIDSEEDEGPRPGHLGRTATIAPTKWPTQPESLKTTRGWRLAMDLYDCLFIALPIGLMVKTSLCIVAHSIDGRLDSMTLDFVSPISTGLLDVNDQIVTAFTIVFVAIMATAIRRYALYKAQNGAYLADLEQLHASISLPDTIKMVFFLRKFTWFSLLLVTVWGFYYLGTQAMLWEYNFSLSGPLHNNLAAFAKDEAVFRFNGSREEPGNAIEYMNSKMTDYLETPAGALLYEQAGVDPDGSVLIPDMHVQKYSWSSSKGLQAITPRVRTQEELYQWMTVHPMTERYTGGYGQDLFFHLKDLHQNASKDGVWAYAGPPQGEKMMGDYTFQTSYLYLQCGSIQVLNASKFPAKVADGMTTSINMTARTNANATNIARTLDIWHKFDSNYWVKIIKDKSPPVINGMNSGVLQVTCNITRPDVELKVKCKETACVGQKMRYLTDPSSNHQLRTPFDDDVWAADFLDNILWSTGEPIAETRNAIHRTPIEGAMLLSDFVGMLQEDRQIISTYGSMDNLLANHSSLLTSHFNSYFNLGIKIGYTGPADSPQLYNTFNFNGALYEPRYRLHWVWIALDYISCMILLVAAIWSFWLRKHTLAPDIFGYVSSLTRDNPYVPVDGGSRLSGIDRARLMRKVKVRIGDVGREGDIGKVGIVYLADAEEGDLHHPHEPLNKHRKYH